MDANSVGKDQTAPLGAVSLEQCDLGPNCLLKRPQPTQQAFFCD